MLVNNWPSSLRSRFLLILVGGVMLAQGTSYAIWKAQANAAHFELVDKVSVNEASSIVSTVRFFRKLPVEYRHIVLDQLRRVGGTRFFVSVNEERIEIDDIAFSKEKQIVVKNFTDALRNELRDNQILVEFSRPEELKVMNNNIMLTDLPSKWAHYSLMTDPRSPPITVVQIELAPKEWLYVATLLPIPSFLSDRGVIGAEELLYLAIMLIVVITIAFVVIRWLTRPLAILQTAAEDFGRDIDHPPLPEKGSEEIVATARAFNHMQERICRYIEDRERLFSAISHDLKTPITRMRLRAELVENQELQEKFIKDLGELDMMVKGALQAVKDTVIQENPENIKISELLEGLGDGISLKESNLRIEGNAQPIRVKPLAIKRALTNLLDNAFFYGHRADVHLEDSDQELTIRIRDYGPGIPETELETVFEPYVRLEKSRNRNTGGSGLGLGIARNIVHAHGGTLSISNHPQHGLQATVTIPRQ